MGKCLGVFDSGIGGLTVFSRLVEKGAFEQYIYFGDTARVPYGTRSAEQIRTLALQDMRFLLSQGADELVVACNTITAAALDVIRQQAGVAVHGVIEPAAAAAVAATKNGRIGLLATQATIDNGAYARAIAALAPGARLTAVACPRFVTLVEAGAGVDDPAVRAASREYLAPVRAAGCDTVIMGCTHFPLLEAAIAAQLAPEVTRIDSGAVLAGHMAGGTAPCAARVDFYVSGDAPSFDARRRRFMPGPWDGARGVDIEAY